MSLKSNVGLPLFDADENGLLIWRYKKIEILLKTSKDENLETGGSVWHAAHRLSEYLVRNPYLVRNKRVLELGCGCGLVGLVAAALGAKTVVLSDIDSQLHVIEENIEMNKYARTVRSKLEHDLFTKCEVSCTSIWFGEAVVEDFEDQYDIILGADIGYDISLHSPLATTIASSLVNKRVVALLCEEVRWRDVYGWYMEALVDKNLTVHDTDADRKATGGTPPISPLSPMSPVRAPSPSLLPGKVSPPLAGHGTIYTSSSFEFITNSPESHGRHLSLISEDEYKEQDSLLTAPSVTKYPLQLEPLPEDTSFKAPVVHQQDDHMRPVKVLIRSIYSKLNKAVEKSAIELNYRVSGCPIKVLKVTKKLF